MTHVPATKPVDPEEFGEILDRLIAAGLLKRTSYLGQANISLTKTGRAMMTLVAGK